MQVLSLHTRKKLHTKEQNISLLENLCNLYCGLKQKKVYCYCGADFIRCVGGLHISEARRRANDKWRDKFDEMRFRVPKGQKEVISNYAAANGESVNAFINRLINEELSKLNTSE